MGRVLAAVAAMVVVGQSAWAADLVSPTDDGLVLGRDLRVVLRCAVSPDVTVRLNGNVQSVQWQPVRGDDLWLARVSLERGGRHDLGLQGWCRRRPVRKNRTFTTVAGPVEVAEAVVEKFLQGHPLHQMRWSWGDAIFLYGLLSFAPRSTLEPQYVNVATEYHRRHARRGVGPVEWADECPPALSALLLERHYGRSVGRPSLAHVVRYLEEAPRNRLGALDHLGVDRVSARLLPPSIWVDSLMMWALLAVEYGLDHDASLARFGLDQPGIFAGVLRDPETGLFFHAWNTGKEHVFPAGNTFWLRGNGWALATFVEMLDAIGPEHDRYDELAALFVGLAEAIEPYRQITGYWDTVVAQPGFAYEESSGTALVAYGWAKGHRLGLLPRRFRDQARDSLEAIVSRLRRQDSGFTMEEISWGTNPSNRWGYRIVPKGRNISYGVGALLLLARELADDDFRSPGRE